MNTSTFFSILAGCFTVASVCGAVLYFFDLSKIKSKESYYMLLKSGVVAPGQFLVLIGIPMSNLCRLLSKPLPDKMTTALYFEASACLLIFFVFGLSSILAWRRLQRK